MPDLAEVSRVLRTMPIKTLLPGVKCTGDCRIIPTDMHRVSTPCQPHSMWRARTGFSDDRCKYALVWCRICSSLMYKVVNSECVPGFGMKMFEDMLGSLFIMQRFLTCPLQLGWKILRPRQFVVMLSIPWIKQIVFEWHHPRAIDSFWKFLNMEGWMGFLFNATADFSYMEYFIGTEDELAEEVRWASNRPGVRTWHAETPPASKRCSPILGCRHTAFEIHQDLLCMHSLHLNAADSRTVQYCFLVRP